MASENSVASEFQISSTAFNLPRHHSNPHTARAFAMSVVKSSSLEKTAVIPKARASFDIHSLSAVT